MTLPVAEAYDFLKQQNLGVISTVSEQGTPEAALVNYGVTENLELILETLQTSRKYKNLYRNPNMAMVVGTGKECLTCQYEGVVSWPTDAALPGLLDIYFAARPEGLLHRGWPDLVYLHVRPTWIRISKYDLMNWQVRELDLRSLASGTAQAVASKPLPPPPE
ncbi:MAG: pyridoxamine 5'-phosphate oxidase family protein [Betaproteobacteria bacterium]|nr:pyridoxamine 5'-phosphate oxidase family protein [Betaproteobacteria bacterium]